MSSVFSKSSVSVLRHDDNESQTGFCSELTCYTKQAMKECMSSLNIFRDVLSFKHTAALSSREGLDHGCAARLWIPDVWASKDCVYMPVHVCMKLFTVSLCEFL